MKSKKLKGFTLIECIVAMAILGIASLLMVQIYGTVAKMNRENNRMNNSLEKQMEYAENELKKANGDPDISIICISSYDNDDATVSDKDNYKVQFDLVTDTTKTDSKKASNFAGTSSSKQIKADVDLYVIGVKSSQDSVTEKTLDTDNTVRYKFILPKQKEDT
ncbi:MAG: prepilin-type N-terminal cleavage/methylation domain-containing protein [Oscillospiraceae bacterium]|nr:prepilin-type N-terminal cleavage/methylation domain-containing protein [Oscillospiraceae bacterium]MDY2847605.1 prepilin-type N-terminal cleavage/methylation domain-containing protein [Oscillospiraceae bacterium]